MIDRAVARRAKRIGRLLAVAYPQPVCELVHRDAFELLAATILSAQCTDRRVNLVTPTLFDRFPDAPALASAPREELERIIHPTGFFRAKAASLISMSAALVDRHGGEVPRELESLVALPGVGRKTANVVLGTAFGIASGVVVDTHVKRLAYRMGLTDQRDPVPIERDLMNLFPRRDWIELSHRLILHGRAVCVARKPRCIACTIAPACARIGVD